MIITYFLVSLSLLLAWLKPMAGQLTPPATPPPGLVVHAVLFYSPTCGHCYYVIEEVLPPLFEKYGDRLQIVGVNVNDPAGQALFQAALQKFSLEHSGVPTLVVGEVVLVGSLDIPEKFPGLIETYLAQGGVDWPDIPGLAEVLGNEQPAESPTPPPLPVESSLIAEPTMVALSAAPTPVTTYPLDLLMARPMSSELGSTFGRDPRGNTLALIVLLGMVASVMAAVLTFRRIHAAPLARQWSWAIPVLCIIGLGVAGYLSYVETAQVTAVCGPVGDCNAVQQSEYARLFGILPIGTLGLVGYVMILVVWLIGHFHEGRSADYASISLLGMTAFGTLFSFYLTFLEPFVIGATCAWCLTSAVLMTALLLLSLAPAKYALLNFSRRKKNDTA